MSTIDEAIARAAKFRAERNEVCWTWERGGPSRIARDRDALAAEIATLTARVEHYKRACITTSAEVTRVLGEALYGPNPDAWSTHTPEAIADEAASEIATLRAENERMRGEIITYQDAHTTGTEIIDELRAKVEALEPSDDVIELIRVAIDPDEPRLSGSCRAMVDVWLQRVEARNGGSDAES